MDGSGIDFAPSAVSPGDLETYLQKVGISLVDMEPSMILRKGDDGNV
jgi:hypothetical protein